MNFQLPQNYQDAYSKRGFMVSDYGPFYGQAYSPFLPGDIQQQHYQQQQQRLMQQILYPNCGLMQTPTPQCFYAPPPLQTGHIAASSPGDIYLAPVTTAPKKSRRDRTSYSKEQLSLLETEFQVNHYPDVGVREMIAHKLRLTETHIQVWFKNRRAKNKKENRNPKVVKMDINATAQYDDSLKRETTMMGIEYELKKLEPTHPDGSMESPGRYFQQILANPSAFSGDFYRQSGFC